jgi:hypothetical protein
MSRDPAFMLKSALKVLRDYRSDAKVRGLLGDYQRGIDGWKRHYVETWAQAAKQSFRSAIASGPAMMSMAPRGMTRAARRFLLDRLR